MPLDEIHVHPVERDVRGEELFEELKRIDLADGITGVRTHDVYLLESEQPVAGQLGPAFTDPVTERLITGLSPTEGPRTIEIGYKPGVMNPAAASIIKLAADRGVELQAADSTVVYAFEGEPAVELIQTIASRLLVNETVQEVIRSRRDTLLAEAEPRPTATVPIREASPEELRTLSAGKLFLNDEEMRVAQDYFRHLKRDPTDAELETIAARWSEHCGHKTFSAEVVVGDEVKKPFIKRIKEAAERQPAYQEMVVSAFSDNSGVIRFYDEYAISGKVETHNSPSAIEPYGGAMTGSGGVFRDIMGTGQGMKTIISTDMFCFAPPDLAEDELPAGVLRPDYLHRRVVEGVRDYGNRMGIPTANGSVHYHPDFRAKPTVIVGAYGFGPEQYAHQGTPEVDDRVIVLGGRTGRDGIHGATFSSGEMTSDTAKLNSSAVQIGNAIEEKRMFDALEEARDRGLIRAMTDCGAAGFSSAIGELGEVTGVTVDIAKAPLKYSGLAPWEIWISESQERMVTAIPPEHADEFMAICKKYNVEATDLGWFDGSNTLTVNHGEENVIELDYDFLINGLPQRVMEASWTAPEIEEVSPPEVHSAEDLAERLKAVLAHGNVASKQPVVSQYDHGVQGGNIVSPYGGETQDGPNDALVVRPMLDKPYGVVQSHGMNPVLNNIDPYWGTVWAIAEGAANYVAAGGDIAQAACVGNYIWPFPDERAMGSLDKSVDAACDMMDVLGVPVISGKDSLSSTYRNNETGEKIEIPPVYTASFFGRIPDVEKTVTTDIKQPGETELFMIGAPVTGLGGSTYYEVTGASSAEMPRVNLEALPPTLRMVQALISDGTVLSCHDVSEGGLAVALAEMCFGSDCGIEMTIPNVCRADEYLFTESAGCFVVEVPKGTNLYLRNDIREGTQIRPIGKTTTNKKITVSQYSDSFGWQTRLDADIDELKQAWQAPLQELFH